MFHGAGLQGGSRSLHSQPMLKGSYMDLVVGIVAKKAVELELMTETGGNLQWVLFTVKHYRYATI